MTIEATTLLRHALAALNAAPRFKFGDSDSYNLASRIGRHLADAGAEAGTAPPAMKRYVVQAYMLTGDEVTLEAAAEDAARKAAAAHFHAKYPESTCEITQVDEVTD